MSNDQYILDHYKSIAHNFGIDPRSTIKDLIIREYELSFIYAEILNFISKNERYPSVLDIGCGNGFLLSSLQNSFPGIKLAGIEFSPDLLKLALQRNIPNSKIIHADIRKKNVLNTKFDIVITERVIINLLSKKSQTKAFKNIKDYLKDKGLYLMIESFKIPLMNLNIARQENKLSPLKESKHNRYLGPKVLHFLQTLNFKRCSTALPDNSLSTHFFNTRIIHPLISPNGGKNQFSKISDFFSLAFDDSLGDYSPIKFYKFQKAHKEYDK